MTKKQIMAFYGLLLLALVTALVFGMLLPSMVSSRDDFQVVAGIASVVLLPPVVAATAYKLLKHTKPTNKRGPN